MLTKLGFLVFMNSGASMYFLSSLSIAYSTSLRSLSKAFSKNLIFPFFCSQVTSAAANSVENMHWNGFVCFVRLLEIERMGNLALSAFKINFSLLKQCCSNCGLRPVVVCERLVTGPWNNNWNRTFDHAQIIY